MAQASGRTTAILATAFALSTLCFLAATAVTEYQSHRIGADAGEIATIAIPASSPLAELRGDLRRLDVLLSLVAGRQIPDPSLLPPENVLPDQIRRVESELTRYLTSPAFPSEEALRPQVHEAWLEVKRAIAQVQEAAAAGSGRNAFSPLIHVYRPAIDRFDAELSSAIAANVDEANLRARDIATQWRRTRTFGLAMTAASVLLTLWTALLAIRTIRRQMRLLAQRAEESVQFAGRVAHDILSPLSPVGMFLEIAQSKGLGDPAVERSLPRARSAMRRITAVVDALLSFAKAGAQPSPEASCDVPEVAHGVLEDQRAEAEQRGIEIELQEPPRVRVRCAPGVLASVLSNLVRNAIKYMGDVRTRRVSVTVREEEGAVRFEVADTGPGIPAEWQAAVFDPWVQMPSRKSSGIGLGLATVKRLVRAHGGEVGLVSAPGQGTRFWFSFPRAGAVPA
jgi:signal transduction histidine kinase